MRMMTVCDTCWRPCCSLVWFEVLVHVALSDADEILRVFRITRYAGQDGVIVDEDVVLAFVLDAKGSLGVEDHEVANVRGILRCHAFVGKELALIVGITSGDDSAQA